MCVVYQWSFTNQVSHGSRAGLTKTIIIYNAGLTDGLQRSQRCFTICFSKSLHSKKFETLYHLNLSMDFNVMGFKLKLIYPSLIGYSFMKLVRSATEKFKEKEEASEPFLCSTQPGSVNKTGSDASSFSSDFSVAERTNFVKPYPIREG